MVAANNYAWGLSRLGRFEEAKSVLRKMMPVTRRVVGESHKLTLAMRKTCARALYMDANATLDDLREAVTTFEDMERTARRVLGGAHPLVVDIERNLRKARAVLRARETRDAFGAARVQLAQERAELAQTLADAARQSSRST